MGEGGDQELSLKQDAYEAAKWRCLRACKPCAHRTEQTHPRHSRPCISRFTQPSVTPPSEHGPQGPSSLCTLIPAPGLLWCASSFLESHRNSLFSCWNSNHPSVFIHLFNKHGLSQTLDTVWAEDGWASLSLLPLGSPFLHPHSSPLSSTAD